MRLLAILFKRLAGLFAAKDSIPSPPYPLLDWSEVPRELWPEGYTPD